MTVRVVTHLTNKNSGLVLVIIKLTLCFILSGGVQKPYPKYKNDILEFDINKREWTRVGNMTYGTGLSAIEQGATGVGVSEVNFADFKPWCQKARGRK